MSARLAEPALTLSPLERSVGAMFGRQCGVAALPDDGGMTPRQALEVVLREAMEREPCLLSFSGGRDSSALLSVAIQVARREGLTPPTPITLSFPHDAESQEGEWQDRVLEHLGVRDREIVRVTGDLLDVVGPAAQEVLTRHGLLWPFNTHWHLPIVRAAAGGSVITGFGGDELAMTSVGRWAERVVGARRRPTLRQAMAVTSARSPSAVRFLRHLQGSADALSMTPWLTRRGRLEARTEMARDMARVPYGWGRVLREHYWRSRWLQATVHSSRVMADWFDTRMVHPFAEPRVLQALAAHAPIRGLGGRTDLMRELFGDLLPDELVNRASKASFATSLWTETARSFTSAWTGAGVDPRLVDRDVLARSWYDRTTSAFSGTLMQAAWMAERPPALMPEEHR